jgi:hypothetical protein
MAIVGIVGWRIRRAGGAYEEVANHQVCWDASTPSRRIIECVGRWGRQAKFLAASNYKLDFVRDFFTGKTRLNYGPVSLMQSIQSCLRQHGCG